MVAVAIGGIGNRRNIHIVLVVDDERHIVRLLQVNLDRAGYKVVVAFSAQEAREVMAREEPDLVIMDVTLPDTDGYTLTRQIRENPDRAYLPVLLLIPNSSDSETDKVLNAGANDYMTKPFNPTELLRILKHW